MTLPSPIFSVAEAKAASNLGKEKTLFFAKKDIGYQKLYYLCKRLYVKT